MHDLGVIHGDLKPVRSMSCLLMNSKMSRYQANILLDEEGNARLTDFGMATVLYNSSTQSASATGNPFGGTVRYMAPELLLGSEGTKLNVQTDIYALAITLWEVCPCNFTSTHISNVMIAIRGRDPVPAHPEGARCFTQSTRQRREAATACGFRRRRTYR
jgi:serine/threonine protein kinase